MPADRATLLALAERCEKATGPDRELDWEIAVAVRPGHSERPAAWLDFTPEPTGSVDAAMALVANDDDVTTCRASGKCYARIYPHGGDHFESAYAATLPLALCAAALRALAETADA